MILLTNCYTFPPWLIAHRMKDKLWHLLAYLVTKGDGYDLLFLHSN